MHAEPGDGGPSAAERARSILAWAPTVLLEVASHRETVDLRVVRPDGALVLFVPESAQLGAVVGPAADCVLHGARLAPLAVPDRLLDPVRVRGRLELVDAAELGAELALLGAVCPERLGAVLLEPDATALWRVTAEEVWLGDVAVDPGAYRAAVDDPLVPGSDEVVRHLMREHVDELGQLAHLIDPELLQGVRLIAPIAVDRRGLVFRLDGDRGALVTRLNFPAALRGPAELSTALRRLQRRAAQVMSCCAPHHGPAHHSSGHHPFGRHRPSGHPE